MRSWSPLRYKRWIRDSISDHYFRRISYWKKSEKFRESLTFSNYIHLPSIILLQLDNLWKANSFLSVLQYWPVLKSGGVRDNLCRPIAEKVNFTKFYQKFKWNLKTWPKILFQESQNPNEYNSTFWKIKKIFYFSYWNNLMEITLPSLLSYPINTIRRLHLTLLTDCVLVDFPNKRKTCLLHQNSFKVTIFVDIITRNKNAL